MCQRARGVELGSVCECQHATHARRFGRRASGKNGVALPRVLLPQWPAQRAREPHVKVEAMAASPTEVDLATYECSCYSTRSLCVGVGCVGVCLMRENPDANHALHTTMRCTHAQHARDTEM